MSNERIDLTQYDERIAMANDPYTSLNSPDEDGEDIEVLVAELKRCYEELDEANQVEKALWNALDNWISVWTTTLCMTYTIILMRNMPAITKGVSS